MEEKVRKFGLFDNKDHQMNYNTLVGCSIHFGDVVDWEFLSNKGLAQYDPIYKGVKFRLGGVERELSLLKFGWRPTIGDGGYNVGNTKAKSIRNPRIMLAHRCIMMTITSGKETTNHVTEIDLFYLYCIFRDVLNREPLPYVCKKTSLIKMGVIMELHEVECCWPATREVTGDGGGDYEEGDGEGGNKGIGGYTDIYHNMSQGEWQVHQAQWMCQQDERWGRFNT
ncbi:hypothetical protein Tco_1380981 [Tanacetum coccineum]